MAEEVRWQPPILVEVIGLWLVTLLGISAVVAVERAGAPNFVLIGVPILFMYAPVWSCRLRGADPWDYPMALPDWPWRNPKEWGAAFAWGLGFAAVIVGPFLLGYHVWQTELVPMVQEALGVRLYASAPALQWTWPSQPWRLVLSHFFFVAIPEEMFYRGYVSDPPRRAVAPAVAAARHPGRAGPPRHLRHFRIWPFARDVRLVARVHHRAQSGVRMASLPHRRDPCRRGVPRLVQHHRVDPRYALRDRASLIR